MHITENLRSILLEYSWVDEILNIKFEPDRIREYKVELVNDKGETETINAEWEEQ